ncbi:bifunctional diguanylate cyclase/phosphodiesterase [Bordetella sp. FB-8]|uniref:putative bifunctional diguanylate cyclase/phosphodiesterase n=1 Tax=Bordetella sp. FB-8 TaxID=1159870 RepID=UPI00037BEE78|nr:EAL domain-containing protein [Bordetella sp. FB-8]
MKDSIQTQTATPLPDDANEAQAGKAGIDPAADVHAPVPTPRGVRQDDAADTARILVVDDNADMLDVYQKILSPPGSDRSKRLSVLENALFEAESAAEPAQENRHFALDLVSDGKTALAHVIAAREQNRPFAMAFMDVRMPGGWDGIETVRQLWRVDPDIHVVLCTAYSDYSWEQMLAQLTHPDRFVVLRKPFDVTEVRQLARSFCERWIKLRRERDRMRVMVQRFSQESQKARQALEASVRRTKRILECDGDVAFVFDSQWCVTYMSQTAEAAFGLGEDQVLGQNFWRAIAGSEHTETYRISHDAVQSQTARKTVEFCRVLNQLIEVAVYPYGDEVYLCIRNLADPAEGAAAREASEAAIHNDRLTGLPDRLSALRYLHHVLDSRRAEDGPLVVLNCDIDRLREINELVGYDDTDTFLAELGRRIRAFAAGRAFAARVSGGEFLFILRGDDARAPRPWADRLLQTLTEPFVVNGVKLEASLSVGFAEQTRQYETAGDLMHNVLAALALAKADRGGGVRCYEREAGADRHAKIELRQEMTLALGAADDLRLYYQPQLCLRTGRLYGAEALIRWRHPRWGMLAPADFIGVAEESSLILRIDAWVIDRACRQIADWRRRGVVKDDFVVSVNISPRGMCDEQFVKIVQQAVERYGVPAARIELEITENMMMRDLEQAVSSLNALKAIGVRVALDDFGVGYSNLDYIRNFPIDKLKIDRGFVKNLEKDARSLLLVEAIIKLAKSLDLCVVAEGVENEFQRTFLQESGCDLVQGYLTGRPLAVDVFEKFSQEH